MILVVFNRHMFSCNSNILFPLSDRDGFVMDPFCFLSDDIKPRSVSIIYNQSSLSVRWYKLMYIIYMFAQLKQDADL